MSAKIDDGGSAFPILPPICSDGHPPAGYPYPDPGMTLRDWFAGQVDVCAYAPMQTFINNHGRSPTINELAEYIAKIRVIEADAMIAERKAKP